MIFSRILGYFSRTFSCAFLFVAPYVFASEYRLESLTAELDTPWAVAVVSEGAMFISERSGNLRYFSDGSLSAPIKGVPQVYFAGQGGLLDVQLHPEFASNNVLFLSFASGKLSANQLEVVSAVWNDKDNRLDKVTSIFKVSPAKDTPVHYAGRMTVLPDNTIALASGDGFDYREAAQVKTSQMGKMLRFNFNGSAPVDNPFTDSDIAKYVWSLGHRNPQALFYDAQSDKLFSHEHGPAGGDEINIIEKSKNYGWPVITNGKDYSGANISPFKTYPGMEQPLFDWTPSVAPSDMILYRGNRFPALTDHLLVTTLKSREVQVLSYSAQSNTAQQVQLVTSILNSVGERFRAIEQDVAGNIYLLTDSGKLLKLSTK